jgi:hypothetical protein
MSPVASCDVLIADIVAAVQAGRDDRIGYLLGLFAVRDALWNQTDPRPPYPCPSRD